MNWQDGIVYARDVIKGEINVCRDVRLSCQRFINQSPECETYSGDSYLFNPVLKVHSEQ